MTSLLPTIEAKSDQLNAEDLIGGPRTVRVTSVKVSASEDQPVWVYFEGDNGKPFKPCKTVRRLLVRVWGDDSTVYAGRSMTLYLDQDVKYGGMAVGGIRVSHVSHIDAPKKFFLTETRGKKREITVKPMPADARQIADDLKAGVSRQDTLENLVGYWKALQESLMCLPEPMRSEVTAAKDKRKAELSQRDAA